MQLEICNTKFSILSLWQRLECIWETVSATKVRWIIYRIIRYVKMWTYAAVHWYSTPLPLSPSLFRWVTDKSINVRVCYFSSRMFVGPRQPVALRMAVRGPTATVMDPRTFAYWVHILNCKTTSLIIPPLACSVPRKCKHHPTSWGSTPLADANLNPCSWEELGPVGVGLMAIADTQPAPAGTECVNLCACSHRYS